MNTMNPESPAMADGTVAMHSVMHPAMHPGSHQSLAEKARELKEVHARETLTRARVLLDAAYSNIAATTASPDSVLRAVACEIHAALHAARVTIAIRKPIGDWQLYHAAVQHDVDTSRSAGPVIHRLPGASSTLGQLQVSLETVRAEANLIDAIRIRGATSSIYVYCPSVTMERRGLLGAQSTTQRTFSREDTALLSAIAELLPADRPDVLWCGKIPVQVAGKIV